jgi:hypothetical protein
MFFFYSNTIYFKFNNIYDINNNINSNPLELGKEVGSKSLGYQVIFICAPDTPKQLG